MDDVEVKGVFNANAAVGLYGRTAGNVGAERGSWEGEATTEGGEGTGRTVEHGYAKVPATSGKSAG